MMNLVLLTFVVEDVDAANNDGNSHVGNEPAIIVKLAEGFLDGYKNYEEKEQCQR